MFRSVMLILGAAAGLPSSPLPGGQTVQTSASEATLALQTVRFFRAEHNLTRVKAFVEVPYALLVPAAGSRTLTYKVGVEVIDSAGLTLYRQAWQGHGRADLRMPGVATVEVIDFSVKPGRYRLQVAVTDSVSHRTARVNAVVRALDSTAVVSDLWLSPEIREAAEVDSGARPGEVWQGNSLITATPRLVLTPTTSRAYYLLEVYSHQERSGSMTMAVVNRGDSTVVEASRPVTVSQGGGVLTGQMDLAGLPPGDYRMRLSLALEKDTVEQEAEFTMRGFGESVALRSSVENAAREAADTAFAQLSSRQIDQAVEPLTYLAKPGELSSYDSDLSLLAKRRFLRAFWSRRDPTPETPANEARDRFYQAIAYANREFREGGRASLPGWKSDRGRIYAKYGSPDDVLRRQQEGTAPRYEVWRYTRERNRYYIFADRTGFGAFHLIHSNDIHETGLAGWKEMLGYYALEDIGQYLGLPGDFSSQ